MRYYKALPILVVLIILPLCGAEPQPQLDWTYTAGGTVEGVDITSDGSLMVTASSDGYVYAINSTGDQVWNYSDDEPFLSIAVTSDGASIVTATDTTVYLLDASGNMKWSKDLGNVNDIAISPDGNLIVAALWNRKVYGLNSVGDIQWELPTDFSVQAVAVSDDYVAAGTASGSVYLLDHSGNPQWDDPAPSINKFVRSVALVGSTVFVAAEGSILYHIQDPDDINTKVLTCSLEDISDSQDGFIAVGCSNGEVTLYEGLKRQWTYDGSGVANTIASAISGSLVVEGVGSEVRFITPPDLIPPVITFTSPQPDTTVSGSVTIDATFDEAIDTLIVEIDGEFAGGALPRQWSTAAYTDGKHTITIEVTDTDGNTAKESIDVYIGEAPPAPQETVPPATSAPSTNEGVVESTDVTSAVEPSGKVDTTTSPVETLSPLDAIPDLAPKRSLLKSAVAVVVILVFLVIAFASYQRRRGAGKYEWKGR